MPNKPITSNCGNSKRCVPRPAESWNQQLEKGKGSNKQIVVDLHGVECGPCKLVAPDIVEELAWKLPNVTFLKVDVDELKIKRIHVTPSVAQEWDVQAMPTFIFLKDGEIVEKFTGVNKMKLQSTVEKLAIETA
ncbi:thioredoxin H1-like [Populus nigra]|uniref:thioredoxin H1-like n=1 Tax=Populus nigra TaxID=3691 RepID=UPI002B266388|nr:thioredoxin H1-like [Populus nigra]